MIEKIRRVVTGETREGKSIFTHVESVTPVLMGETRWYGVWGWDEPPTLPYCRADAYAPRSAFPDPEGAGMRLNVITFPPGAGVVERTGNAQSDTATSPEWKRLSNAQPYGHLVDTETGMHSTDSVDIGIVISGEICIAQADDEVLLQPGDIYIQNGATHAWRNRSEEPCTMALVLLSARRRPTDEPGLQSRT
jgi:mannose-6-phosphate isomerase-like protein (cupin superfamily)